MKKVVKKPVKRAAVKTTPRAKQAAPSPFTPCTALGVALRESNEKARASLKALGFKLPPPHKIPGDYPFTHTLGLYSESRLLDRAARGLAGEQARPPVFWPDMKQVEAEVAAKRAPMSEEVKTRLRARAVAKGPRDRGDPIAVKLREAKDLSDVYKIAGKYLGVKPAALEKQYAHLNPGQRRMCCGNRMRAKWRKTQEKP